MRLFLIIGLLLAWNCDAAVKEFDYFNVKVQGQQDKPAMLLIPGLSSSGDVWRSTVAAYSQDYQTHTFTLSGFAGVPLRRSPSLEHTAEHLVKYLKDNQLKDSIVIGHSLGGFMAMKLSLKAPELISKVIIVDSLPFLSAGQNPAVTEEMAKGFASNMKQQILAPVSDEVYRANQVRILSGMITNPSHVETATQWAMSSDKTMVASSVYEMMTTDLRDDIESIKLPTLILGSWAGYKAMGGTKAMTMGVLKSQYQKMPNKTILLAENARHFIMFDEPQWMLEQFKSFL